jgi:hypothetical protein
MATATTLTRARATTMTRARAMATAKPCPGPVGPTRAHAGPRQRLAPWTSAGLSAHAPWERGF